MITGLICQ